MSQHNKISYIYNPANQTYEELLKNFVIRKKEFKRIFNEIEDVDLNCSAQHFLIEGQRGTGKTSLLLRLKYEIENNDKLDNLIVIQFAEESYNIFDLCRIWESCAEILEDTDGFETINDDLESMNEDDDYSKECFYIFEKHLIKNNKRLVLLLDNFGDILDKLSDIEQKRLRDIFHTSNYIQLITSSSRSLEHTYKHDKPFFEFFEIVKLGGLNKEETNRFLKQLSLTSNNNIDKIIEEQPQRIETIRRLTGGIPRTIVLLFEIFLDDSANVFEDLEMILDRVTPLYKHRMDDLPTKQQAIMDTIALNWDGITTKEIVQGLNKRGFDTKGVSSQLKVLEKNNLVLSKNIDKKNKLYMVKERFFNIWYLMRYGKKKNKLQVQWLIRFLQEWCDGEEINERARKHIQCAKENKLHSKGGLYMGEALASVVKDSKLQHELLNETKNALRKFDENIDKRISKSDIDLFNEALKAGQNKKYDLAIKNYKILAQKSYEDAMYNLALLYDDELKDFDEAIKYYKMAIEREHSGAMNNLALLYENELKDVEEAIKYYKMAIEKEDSIAMYNLALLYKKELKDFEEAIKYYKMAIDKENSSAMNNLAYLYYEQNKEKEKSLELLKKSIKIKHTQNRLYNLAIIFLWNNKYQESVNTIKEFITDFEYRDFTDSMIAYFIFLISKKQYHLTYNLFEEFPNLKIEFKPIYYTLMRLLKDEYPKEYLKMGEELEQTVEEILVKIEEKTKKYE